MMKSLLSIAFLSAVVFIPTTALFAKKKPVESRPKVQQSESPQPAVTIRKTKQATIKEYRINGVLRAIKFTPSNGMPPYYLYDQEGSGEFIRISPDTGKPLVTPQWILFSW